MREKENFIAEKPSSKLSEISSDDSDFSGDDSDSDVEAFMAELKKKGIRTEGKLPKKSTSNARVDECKSSPRIKLPRAKYSHEARKKLFADEGNKKSPIKCSTHKVDMRENLKEKNKITGKVSRSLVDCSPTTISPPRRKSTRISYVVNYNDDLSQSMKIKRTPSKVDNTEKKRYEEKYENAERYRKESTTDFEDFDSKKTFVKRVTKADHESPRSDPIKRNKRAHSVEANGLNCENECTPQKRRRSELTAIYSTPTTKIMQKVETPRTPLEVARSQLHVSTVPESLPCREDEFSNIFNFLNNKLEDGIGGCMYISGVPGTGKTATVTSVIKRLQILSNTGGVPPFNYIEINGMRLSDPRQAYLQLWLKISKRKERISAEQAQKKLDTWFNSADHKKITTVVLVDELDLMCTRKQDVVYNLLDWPSKPRSRLVVLTIANTMDMPERKLKGRVNSRLGLTRLTFLPYTHKQLEEIILARLQGNDAFVPDAIRLAARKVAAVSGDARRALDICRRATELPAPNEAVRVKHIEMAIKEMTHSNIVKFIRSCSEYEKLFLQSVSEVCTRTGLEEVDCLQVVDHLLSLCTLEGLQRPPVSSILCVCYRLKCFRLLFSSDHRAGVLQRLTLNLTQDDLHYALKVDA